MQASSPVKTPAKTTTVSTASKHHTRSSMDLSSTPKTFKVVQPLNKSKYKVYLSICNNNQKYYAIKVYPYKKGAISSHYVRESQISQVSHPHIINVIQAIPNFKLDASNANPAQNSAVVMELANNGDFASVLDSAAFCRDTKLVRTYFHQLVSGLEYLHSNGICHLDLKPENLLLNKDYLMKVADFDSCYIDGDKKIVSRGTGNFRAPEIICNQTVNPELADIYSAGIFLFAMRCGLLPYSEEDLINGIDLFELAMNDFEGFWKMHNELNDNKSIFTDMEFKDLIKGMIKFEAKKRYTLKDIKNHKWFNGPTYNYNETKVIMTKLFKGKKKATN